VSNTYCVRINYYEIELIIAAKSSPHLPNVSFQKTIDLIKALFSVTSYQGMLQEKKVANLF
jgi:hypothetical protein